MIVPLLVTTFFLRLSVCSADYEDSSLFNNSIVGDDDGTAIFDEDTDYEDISVERVDYRAANFCDICRCSNQTKTLIMVDCNPVHDTGGIGFLPTWPDNVKLDQNVSIVMDLSYNEIRKIYNFSDLPVVTLDLSHNDLRMIGAGGLQGIAKSVQKLDLSSNKLNADSVSKKSFQGVLNEDGLVSFSVVDLSLARNRLHTVEPDFFEFMIDLTILDLSENPLGPLTKDFMDALNSIKNLESLSLRQTDLDILPTGFLLSLDKLTYLDLAGNKFTQVDPQLRQIPSLESLNLNANLLRSLDSSSFENLSSLNNLSVSDCPMLKYVDQYTFKDLDNLQFLRMRDNVDLTWISPDAWPTDADATLQLIELDISNNALEYLPDTLLHSLSDWKYIDVINIQGNPWMCDCHSAWLMYHLVPLIYKSRPDLTQDILCAGPKKSHLIKEEIMVIIQLLNQTELDCSHREFSFYVRDFNIEDNSLEDPRPRKQMLPLALTIICVTAIMGTTLMVGYLYLEKKKILSLRIRRPQRDNPVPRVAYFPANFGRNGYSRHEDETPGTNETTYTDLPRPGESREMDQVTFRSAPTQSGSAPTESGPAATHTTFGVINSNYANEAE